MLEAAIFDVLHVMCSFILELAKSCPPLAIFVLAYLLVPKTRHR